MADLADAVCNSNHSSLFTSWCGYKCCLPGQLQVESRVGAADKQDEAEVTRSDVQGANQHAGAGGAEYDGYNNVVEGFLEAAGRICEAAGDGVSDSVRGRLHKIGGQGIEFERLHDLFSC